MSVVYAVWTGIGAAGGLVWGILAEGGLAAGGVCGPYFGGSGRNTRALVITAATLLVRPRLIAGLHGTELLIGRE